MSDPTTLASHDARDELTTGTRQERNVALTRRGFDAYNTGDLEALAEILHPDVELRAAQEMLNAGEYRGREGFIEWNAQWTEAWAGFVAQPAAIEPVGDDCVLVETHQVAKGAGSGIDVEMTVFWAFELDGEKVTRMHLHTTREHAMEAIERWRGERRA